MVGAELATEGSSLSVRKVTKSFPKADNASVHTLALDAVSLFVGAGELVSLIGPSGCGKSTLLRLIAGLDSPSFGELRIGAEWIDRGARRGTLYRYRRAMFG